MKKYNYVYKITNLVNGKIYIGKHSTDDVNDGYMGSGVVLRQAYKKYGLECFTKEVIDYYNNTIELNQGEIYWIAQFNSTNSEIGYNLTYGGDGGTPTEETRRKVSHTLKGRHHTEETRQKISAANKGKSSPNKGKTFSEEYRRKLSESHKGQPGFWTGKPLSEETKQKISAANKGRQRSEETKQKMSVSKKGHPGFWTGKKRKPVSEETKQKMRLAWQRRKENKIINENHTKKY